MWKGTCLEVLCPAGVAFGTMERKNGNELTAVLKSSVIDDAIASEQPNKKTVKRSCKKELTKAADKRMKIAVIRLPIPSKTLKQRC